MGSMSIWHWIIVAGIVMLLFGRGKISDLMGDVAKGIKAFKKGMAEDETPAQAAKPAPGNEPVRTLPHAAETAPGTAIPASHVSQADKV
ncbi:twin-arginine translocase TatA/TatE family subunit [Methylobacterium sp. sgz302541]|uniref:twin-arginine translocase TatA/TatE family subunit n=1 Tax=unclassified Methylobacterium TaxID=2615210 RepID=UPI003D340FF3